MTTFDSHVVVGVDVAKDEIVVYRRDLEKTQVIANEGPALKKWLRSLPADSAIAIEATNIYHIETIELAYSMGHRIFVVDPGKLSKYRDSLGKRAKTDASDAALLARYLAHEGGALRLWSPPPEVYNELKNLLHRRAKLVSIQVTLRQSWGKNTDLQHEFGAVIDSLKALDRAIQEQMKNALNKAGLMPQIQRCEGIEGVGFLTATAFLTAFMRGEFENSDAYIAFLGLDLCVRDSGKKFGRRKLTKKGDPEIRRLGHNASMAACRTVTWKPFYQRHLESGKARTQALVILTRKLARVAFSLMKNQTDYRPNSMFGASPQT
ncbi:MAG: transposase [Pseudomonas sp.]